MQAVDSSRLGRLVEISGKRTGLNDRLGGEAHPCPPVFHPRFFLLPGIPFKTRIDPFNFAELGRRG